MNYHLIDQAVVLIRFNINRCSVHRKERLTAHSTRQENGFRDVCDTDILESKYVFIIRENLDLYCSVLQT